MENYEQKYKEALEMAKFIKKIADDEGTIYIGKFFLENIFPELKKTKDELIKMEDKIFNFLINYFSNINNRGVDEMNNFRGDITSDEIVEWLKNIQNTSLEQPSEDFKGEFDDYLIHGDIRNPNFEGPFGYDDIRKTAIHFAQWQKEQDKALIERAEDHAKLAGIALGEKEAKEKFINKACEWLKENIYNRVYKYNDSLGFPTATFLEEFRKAMEE